MTSQQLLPFVFVRQKNESAPVHVFIEVKSNLPLCPVDLSAKSNKNVRLDYMMITHLIIFHLNINFND